MEPGRIFRISFVYFFFCNSYVLALFFPIASISSIAVRISLVLAILKPSSLAMSLVFADLCSCKYNLIFCWFLFVFIACFLSPVF